MCVVTIPINDGLMQQMRPLFASEEGITQWMQEKMTSLIKRHIAAEEKRKAQKATQKDSTARAEQYLRQHSTPSEYAELMATDFLNKPYPPYANQTEAEIEAELKAIDEESHLTAEESMAWLKSLVS